jgi:membrane protease YdiL (CAAX protease family)
MVGFLNLAAMVATPYFPSPILFPMVFLWLIPFLMALRVEGNTPASLGLVFDRERTPNYLVGILTGFALLTVLLGLEHYARIHIAYEAPGSVLAFPGGLASQFLVQLMGIGLPEEFFFRGYLLTRFKGWLGDRRGLLLNSLLFGLGHLVSRLTQHGLGYAPSALFIGLQTFLGGLILGYLYLRSRTVLVPAGSHILLNLFAPSITAAFL